MVFLLPFSCLSPFLNEHPLCRLSRVDVKNVYDSIIEALTNITTEEAERRMRKSTADRSPRTIVACTNCNASSHSIDHHASELICDNCGKTAEFNDQLDSYEERTRNEDHRGLHAATKVCEMRDEIDHWNRYPSSDVALDEESASKIQRRAIPLKKGTVGERAIACILLHTLEQQEDLLLLSQSVRLGEKTRFIEYISKQKERCPRCNFVITSKVDMRRHKCEWGRKRRAVPSQKQKRRDAPGLEDS